MLKVFVLLWRGEKQKAREEVARPSRSAKRSGRLCQSHLTPPGRRVRALASYDRLVRLDPAAHGCQFQPGAGLHLYGRLMRRCRVWKTHTNPTIH